MAWEDRFQHCKLCLGQRRHLSLHQSAHRHIKLDQQDRRPAAAAAAAASLAATTAPLLARLDEQRDDLVQLRHHLLVSSLAVAGHAVAGVTFSTRLGKHIGARPSAVLYAVRRRRCMRRQHRRLHIQAEQVCHTEQLLAVGVGLDRCPAHGCECQQRRMHPARMHRAPTCRHPRLGRHCGLAGQLRRGRAQPGRMRRRGCARPACAPRLTRTATLIWARRWCCHPREATRDPSARALQARGCLALSRCTRRGRSSACTRKGGGGGGGEEEQGIYYVRLLRSRGPEQLPRPRMHPGPASVYLPGGSAVQHFVARQRS
eukprot:365769-Chlamydomonas_euryale.AAC.1